MTFNLRYPEVKDGPDYWPNRIGRVAAVIKEHRPLVFGTQEGYLTMLDSLTPLLDHYAWVGNGRFGGHENEHCAVFYDTREAELAEHGQFWLSETPDEVATLSYGSMFPRICTWVRLIRRADGAAFCVYNTHLDHRSAEAREQGIRIISERIRGQRETNRLPAILLGDFNSGPDDAPIRFLREGAGGEAAGAAELDAIRTTAPLAGRPSIGSEPQETVPAPAFRLTDAYSVLPGHPGLTAHSFRGGDAGDPIDYIFASQEFAIVSVQVDRAERDGGYPSDHYPIVAKLRLAD